jgi:hypothetical protein
MNEPLAGINRWTVLGPDPKKKYHSLCRCSCGTERSVRTSSIESGRSKSCECGRKQTLSDKKTHGLSNTPEYRAWLDMKSRCLNPKHRSYEKWGGRGITVCPRWIASFENFYADVGKRPSSQHSLERDDNNGHYEPSNAGWDTKTMQNRNRGNTVKITSRNLGTRCVAEWAAVFMEHTRDARWTTRKLTALLNDKLLKLTIDDLLDRNGITDLSADCAEPQDDYHHLPVAA